MSNVVGQVRAFISMVLIGTVEGCRDVKGIIVSRLRMLMKVMRSSRQVSRVILIGRAKVPIVKATLSSGLQMDISMGVVNGRQAVDYIGRQVAYLLSAPNALHRFATLSSVVIIY